MHGTARIFWANLTFSLQAGRMSIEGGGFRDFEYHNAGFPSGAVSTFTHVQTFHDAGFVKTWQQPGDASPGR
jgi:hypothetical protein